MGRSNSTDKEALGLKKVGSTTGFSAGDPIYETTSGTGKVPDAYISSAPFSATGDITVPNSIANLNAGTYKLFGMTASGTGPHYAITLANGNVAMAYHKAYARSSSSENAEVYLKVSQPDGTAVFADVDVTGGNTSHMRAGGDPVNMAVTQLANDSIVICWTNGGSSGYVMYAIVNSTTGAIIAGPTQDTGVGVYGATLCIDSLPNGNWVIACMNKSASYYTYWRVFDNTGTAVSSWTTNSRNAGTGDNMQSISVKSRADSTFVVCQNNATSGTGIYYSTCAASGSITFNGSQVANTGYDCRGGQLLLTSSDEIVYVWQDGIELLMSVMPNTQNNFDAVVRCQNINSGSFEYGYLGGTGGQIRAHCLSGTNKIYIVGNVYRGPNVFMFYDTSGNKLADYLQDFTRGWGRSSFCGAWVELADEVRWYSATGLDHEEVNRVPVGIWYKTFNKNYTLFGGSGITGALGTASGVTTAAYSSSGSTAKSASFRPASDGATQATKTETSSFATVILNSKNIEDATTRGYAVCAKDGGGFILAREYQTSKIDLLFYDKEYSLEKTVQVTSTSGNYDNAVAVCQLGNGKIVCVWGISTQVAKFAVYNPDGSVHQAEATLNTSYPIYFGVTWGTPAIAPVIGDEFTDEFILAYCQYSTRYTQVECFDQTGSSLFAQNYVNNSGEHSYYSRDRRIIPMPGGDFFCTAQYPGGYNQVLVGQFMRKPGATSNVYYHNGWSNRGNGTYSSQTSGVCSSGRFGSPIVQVTNSSGTPEAYFPRVYHGSSSYLTCSATSANYDRQNFAFFGVGGSDQMFYGDWQRSQNSQIGIHNHGPGRDNGTDQNYNNVIDYSSHNAITCQGTGNDVVYIRASASSNQVQITLDVYRPYNEFTNVSYTAAASSSDPVDLASNRAAFLGVAVSDCPAGGSGDVQTKGTASLASTYKDASAESFDFVSRSTDGKSGSQSGRTVTIKES